MRVGERVESLKRFKIAAVALSHQHLSIQYVFTAKAYQPGLDISTPSARTNMRALVLPRPLEANITGTFNQLK